MRASLILYVRIASDIGAREGEALSDGSDKAPDDIVAEESGPRVRGAILKRDAQQRWQNPNDLQHSTTGYQTFRQTGEGRDLP